jgi:manganese transport protein
LVEIGFSVRPAGRDQFEIAGIPDTMIERFSKRSLQIKARVGKSASAAQKEVAALATLIVSGLSSSTVGTMAGQMIMQGFVGFQIPIWIRRLVTMLPAFVVVALGANPTRALVISQVVLSFALPLPMVSLLIFTRRTDIMGQFVNSRLMQIAALLGTALVLVLNIFLILQILGVPIPGL